MSAIFGELLSFGQENGQDVSLLVFGDEHYARYETKEGYTVVYDTDRGLFCYATILSGRLVSTGRPMTETPPTTLRRHLKETEAIRRDKAELHRLATLPPPPPFTPADTMRTFGANSGLLPGRRLSVGSVRGLTVLVEFQDVHSTVTKADVSDMLNAPNYTRNGNFCSAREFFKHVSNGKLDYTNDVVGPFRLSKPRDYYITNLLVKEALDLAIADGVDLGRYDSRGEGIVDALNILYAGQTMYMGELWPHNAYLELQYGAVRTGLYLLTSMGRSSGDLSIGTFCHENGHLLCRFPDMYDYGNRDGDGVESAGIGAYCLMGSGNHNNNGRTPSPVCAYLRDLAGWCDNVIILNTGSRDIAAKHGDYGTVLKFETDNPTEYFIVENRAKSGLDQALPASGLAVYHCDTRGSNEWQEGSEERHYQCALLQADGHLDLEHNLNQGDGGDLFAAVPGIALSHNTLPSSRAWDGGDSRLVLSKISPADETITCTIGEDAVAPAIHAEMNSPVVIPDNDPAGINSTLSLNHQGTVGQIRVGIDITHSYIGDLVVEVVDPSGHAVMLHNRQGGQQDNLVTAFDSSAIPALGNMRGRAIQGSWILRVKDLENQDIGKLNQWSLDIVPAMFEQTVKNVASPNAKIPDADPTGISSVITIDQPGIIRTAKVSLDISHTFIGDLRLELLSPSGRRVILQNQLGGDGDDLVITYKSGPGSPLTGLIGESIQGNWMLRVADLAGQDAGTLKSWGVEFAAGV